LLARQPDVIPKGDHIRQQLGCVINRAGFICKSLFGFGLGGLGLFNHLIALVLGHVTLNHGTLGKT